MLASTPTGLMNGTVAALEPMLAAGHGHVINIVSLAGIVAAPGEVAYSASKHASMAFTLGTLFDLRRAGLKGIELSAVCPDGIWTPMLEDKLDDPDAAGSFSGHLLTAEEVGHAVGKLTERPRPVLFIPRWRGPMLRLLNLFPRLIAAAAAARDLGCAPAPAALQEPDRVRQVALEVTPTLRLSGRRRLPGRGPGPRW